VPGGIEVTFETAAGGQRTVEVVMTPTDWDGYITTIYGTGDPRSTPFKQKVLAMPDTAPHLVYDGAYDWQPSPTREVVEEVSDPRPGQWVVTDAEGNVLERFADFDDRS
jgi:hypothetical protein